MGAGIKEKCLTKPRLAGYLMGTTLALAAHPGIFTCTCARCKCRHLTFDSHSWEFTNSKTPPPPTLPSAPVESRSATKPSKKDFLRYNGEPVSKWHGANHPLSLTRHTIRTRSRSCVRRWKPISRAGRSISSSAHRRIRTFPVCLPR